MKRAALALALIALFAQACSSSAPATRPSAPAITPSRTPSVGARAFVFAVKGDWGAGTRAQREVTDAMCALRKRVPFKYVVTTGDNFYSPDGIATRGNYYDPERCLYSFPGHVWRPVWGNHDVAGPSTANVLGATQRYYTWQVGSTQFFMLDGNTPGDAEQRSWFARALQASRARAKIAVFHQPAFTSGLHTDLRAAQTEWVPLFERYHVQLVLNGHNHDYEHLKVGGVDYVISGGGGQSIYPCLRAEPGAIRCTREYNFLLVRVTQLAIDVEALTEHGARLDRFTIPL